MPAVARQGDLSTGHGCFPPTACTSASTSKTFVDGLLVQTVTSTFLSHRCGKTTHPSSIRKTTTGSSKVIIEGRAAIRIGDPIQCGDTVGQGSSTTFIG